jgi:CRISPR-associated protein Cas5t
MVHNVCEFKEYVPMAVSIQGNYFSKVNNYQIFYYFKPNSKYEPERHQLYVDSQIFNRKIGINRSPANVELLVDVNLVIHIKMNDPGRLQEVFEKLKNPNDYISLGRREDLALINNIKIVSVEPKEFDEVMTLKNNFYIPVDSKSIGNIQGTVYDLNVTYKISKNGFRQWNKQKVFYASGDTTRIYGDEPVLVDDEGDFVFFVNGGNSIGS